MASLIWISGSECLLHTPEQVIAILNSTELNRIQQGSSRFEQFPIAVYQSTSVLQTNNQRPSTKPLMSVTGFSVEQDPEVQAYKRFRAHVLAEEKRKKDAEKRRKRVEKAMTSGVVEEDGKCCAVTVAREVVAEINAADRRNVFSRLFRYIDRFDRVLARNSGGWQKQKELFDDSSDDEEMGSKEACKIEVRTKT
ncbi:hypothetical protein H2198_010028 [Neophaeococcomyces mojaviensis]|uniref:Uncharacterized protein n=1 Tax=Neophaeococcomyces mojaviensis TaxID=3383035 RepID=A0ACC2ZT28_9EURO|nr:hypothetical protein H2198_010028 [Knufia sp. JES_112]